MNKAIYILFVFLLTFHSALSQNEDGSSRFIISTGLPFVENKEVLLNIQVADREPGEGIESNIRITTYYFDGRSLNDSLLLYKAFLEKVSIVNVPVQKTIRLAGNEEQEGFYIHSSYKDQLLKTNLNQPGSKGPSSRARSDSYSNWKWRSNDPPDNLYFQRQSHWSRIRSGCGDISTTEQEDGWWENLTDQGQNLPAITKKAAGKNS